MKITQHILLLAVIALALPTGRMAAQSDTLSMDVTFTGTKELFLKNSVKLSSWPKIRESVVEMPPIKYSLMPFKPMVSIAPRTIEAAKVNVEDRLPKLYRGYARGGFGLYNTAMLDVYYMDERSRDGSWGILYKHLSSTGGVALEDTIPDNFSHNRGHIWGRRLMSKHALNGDLEWNRRVVHAYGIDPQLFFDARTDNLRHRFNDLTGSVGLESFYRDSTKINYNGGIRFRNFSDLAGGIENNVDVRGHLRKFNQADLYQIDFGFNYNEFTFGLLDQSGDFTRENVLIDVRPMVTTRKGNLELKVGAGIWLDARGEQPFHFYPIAEASFSILEDLIVPYAGLHGRMELNTYHNITERNPFAMSDIALRNTNRKLEVFGGIRGALSSAAGFNIRVSNTQFDDFLYFVNDTLDGPGNRFSALYDNLNVFNLRAEFTVNTSDNFRLQARGDYFIYTTDQELHAWYQPTTRMTLSAAYDIDRKLIASIDIFTEGMRRAKSLVQVRDDSAVLEDDGSYTVNLNAYVDANLNIEYRYTKRLSGWLRFNNFLASRYAFWNLYPVQRFNAMMGASYSF